MAATSTLGQAVEGVMARLVALEMLAVPSCKNAVPYIYHVQSSWPYWTNTVLRLVPELAGDRTVTAFTLVAEMRLVFGHMTSVYDGGFEAESALTMADVVAYFVKHARLAVPDAEDASLHKPPRWLSPVPVVVRAEGVRAYEHELSPTSSVVQVAGTFELTCSLHVTI